MNSVVDLPKTAGSVLERAQSVTGLLQDAAPRIEANSGLTDDVVSAMHQARLFRATMPAFLGGDNIDLHTHAQLIETIASSDASTAWCLSQGLGCAMASAFMSPDAAKRFFGSPDSVLAWGAGIQGKAVACDGGYRVTGKWQFASGSRHATILGGHSYVFEADGETPRLHANGRKADRTALFIREKAIVHDVWDVIGLRGTGSDTFEVDNLFVPEDETVDREDRTVLNDASPIFQVPSSLVYAIGFAGLQLGIARAILDELRDLAKNKQPRGMATALKDSVVFQTQLAQLEGRLRSARAYLLETAEQAYTQTAKDGRISSDSHIAIRLCSTHVINEGAALTTDVYRAAGATAIFPTNPFERRLRDALTASQQVQGRIDHYATVGRHLLGLKPDANIFL